MTIHSKANSIAYDAGYDAIFGSKEQSANTENSTQATASRERIWDELKRIAKEWIGQDDVALASSFDDLGADSLDQIEMLMDVEETFEIEIDDDEASKFKTGNDVLDYLVIHVPN